MSASKPQDPTREGYIFIEWVLNGMTYDFSSPVNENIELKARWQEDVPEKELVTIKFNSDGATTIANVVIEKGSKVEKPADPTKDGYTFVEWQLSNSKYDFDKAEHKPSTNKPSNNSGNNNSGNKDFGNNTPTTPNTPTVKKYTVSFNSNGGSSVASQTVEDGSKATKPANPTRSGYTFAGWTLNGSNYDFNSAVKGNITLVAKWNQKSYTIKINAVDDYSPARILSVYENGSKITVKEIRYSDGTYLCSGSNPNVNKNVIAGETNFIVVLSDGTQVTARVN